ncbi:MAG: hypothetical protein WHT28_08895 [Fimbriimonadales bacterium]
MMQKLFDAVQALKADNPLGLPVIKHVSQAVPVRGTNIRSGVFYVITERETLEFARNLASHPRMRFLEKVRYNVLDTHFKDNWRTEPGTVPRPDTAVLILYDYTNNVGYRVEADFPYAKRVELTLLKEQPDTFSEVEYQEAVQILASDPKFGEPLRRGIAFCSPGMPPVITQSLPSVWERFDPIPVGKPAPSHRTVSVLMHFRPGSGREGEVGVFAIDMVDQRVAALGTGESDFFPAACNGPASGGGCSGGGGSEWQALAWPASNPVWQMLVRRPSGTTSDQNYGAGVELRDVYYNGRLVLRRGGMPVLNVFYDGNSCGPYRDWLYSETCFKCTGTDLGNGLRFAAPGQKAITICDDANDSGNFRGVGVYEDPDTGELVLITECSAGWYRYITGWRFHPAGILKPRFQYGYTDSSCVCYGRLHNGYWRLHFALDGQGGLVVEETDMPYTDPRARWMPIRIEARRYRPQNRRHRYWRVRKLSTGFTATFVPGPKDGFFETNNTGEADFWVLAYHANGSGDGELIGSSGSFANISQYVNGERTYNADLVVWYGVHLRKRGADTFECPPLGPDIILRG